MANRATRRASGVDYPTSLDEWAHDGIITVQLPAVGDHKARLVDYELPNLWSYVALGRVPNPLASLAMRIRSEVIAPDSLSSEEKVSYYALQTHIIATHLKRPNLVEELGSEDAAVAWVAANLPEDHLWKLWMLSVHIFDPAEMAEQLRGLLDLESFRDRKSGEDVPSGSDADGAVTG